MTRFNDRKQALKKFKEIDSNKKDYLIIHYSCMYFKDSKQSTPKINSIVIRNYFDEQTTSFSISLIAEQKGIKQSEIKENWNDLEKKMLDDYFKFVDINKEKHWIHWHMRDQKFGFKAIEQRYKILKGNPTAINDSLKIDLPVYFKMLFGNEYVSNPTMSNLAKLNNLSHEDFISGSDEAQAMERGDYERVTQSTLRKTDMFSEFITYAINGKLRTDAKFKNIYGKYLWGYYELATNTIWGKLIITALGLIVGGIIGAFISKYFF